MSVLAFAALLVAAPAPTRTVSVHGDLLRLDLDRGVRLGGSPEDERPWTAPLVVARDEVVSLQLVVRGAPGVARVHTSSAAGLRVSTAEARGVPVSRASASTARYYLGPGNYPDPLVPTSTLTVRAAPGVALLWLDVWAEREATPGPRRVRVAVEGADPVDLTVEISAVTLPLADAARLGAVNFGSLLERRARDPRRFLEWMQLAHAHRLTIELMLTRPATTADGALDWARWADDYAPLLDGRAFTAELGYRGPRAGVPVGRFVVPLSDDWPSAATPAGLPSDPARWSRELARWEAEVLRRGWLDAPAATEWIVFINHLDEPRAPEQLEALRQFGALIDAAGLRDRRHVAMRVDGALGQGAEGWSDERILRELGPAVDLWCVCGGTAWSPWRLLERRRAEAPDEGLMFYASNSSGEPATPPVVLDAELAHARAWGWVVARYQLAGALNWEVDFRPGCARDPQCAGYGLNGDATLIYRGEDVGRAFDEPIASIRLATLRRGAQDAALLSLLAERDPAAARALAERMVPRAMGDGGAREGPGSWPLDGATYQRARAYLLARLQGEPASLEAVRAPPSDPRWWWVVLAAVTVAAGAGWWRARASRAAPRS